MLISLGDLLLPPSRVAFLRRNPVRDSQFPFANVITYDVHSHRFSPRGLRQGRKSRMVAFAGVYGMTTISLKRKEKGWGVVL